MGKKKRLTTTKGRTKVAKRPAKKPPKKVPKSATHGAAKQSTTKTLRKPTKKSTTKVTRKPAKKPTQRPTKRATTKRTPKQRIGKETIQAEATWVVWEDVRGIWLGLPYEFQQSKRLDTIICDVLDTGSHREFGALHRAVQLGQVLRQTYANCVRQYGREKLTGNWLQFDDAGQEQRIREWEKRLKSLPGNRKGS